MNLIDVTSFLIGFLAPIFALLFLGIFIRFFIWIMKCLSLDEDDLKVNPIKTRDIFFIGMLIGGILGIIICYNCWF